MAEVSAIVNNRPLTAISNDLSAPELLPPSTLLTRKTLPLKQSPGNFTPKELYTKQIPSKALLVKNPGFLWSGRKSSCNTTKQKKVGNRTTTPQRRRSSPSSMQRIAKRRVGARTHLEKP
jgi:hypothetical protein